jgi:hypothetical protein
MYHYCKSDWNQNYDTWQYYKNEVITILRD